MIGGLGENIYHGIVSIGGKKSDIIFVGESREWRGGWKMLLNWGIWEKYITPWCVFGEKIVGEIVWEVCARVCWRKGNNLAVCGGKNYITDYLGEKICIA